MSTIPGSHCSSPLSWQPAVVSFFEVDNFISTAAVYTDIRRYGWDQPFDGLFEPRLSFLSFRLAPPSGRVAMRRAGQQQFLEPGNIAFIPAGQSFLAHCDPSELYELNVTFDSKRVAQALEHDIDLCNFAPEMDLHDARVRQCLARLAKEVAEPGFASEVVVDSLTVLLMVEVCRHLRVRDAAEATAGVKMADWRVRRIVERIHATLDQPLSVAELAAEFGISARHLLRTFKNSTGITLGECIADARIQHACKLLADEAVLIKQVAASCGFRSSAAFAVAFRAATGQSPREYQQKVCFSTKSK